VAGLASTKAAAAIPSEIGSGLLSVNAAQQGFRSAGVCLCVPLTRWLERVMGLLQQRFGRFISFDIGASAKTFQNLARSRPQSARRGSTTTDKAPSARRRRHSSE